jgi:F0F1-type ATP synthase delta subunit
MIEIITVALIGFLFSLIGHYLGTLLSKSQVTDEIKSVLIEYDSGESAKVEITGELSKQQLDELLKMIQEKFASPPEEQTAVPINP